jgi:hypothetical protein
MESLPLHPNFSARPDENRIFSPQVSAHLIAHGFECVTVDGIFDLLISNKISESNGYLELKVGLESGGYPASPMQWSFFRTMPHSVAAQYRVFIYNHSTRHYCLASISDILPAVPTQPPKSTWYFKRKQLNKLKWLEPQKAYEALISWANGL